MLCGTLPILIYHMKIKTNYAFLSHGQNVVDEASR